MFLLLKQRFFVQYFIELRNVGLSITSNVHKTLSVWVSWELPKQFFAEIANHVRFPRIQIFNFDISGQIKCPSPLSFRFIFHYSVRKESQPCGIFKAASPNENHRTNLGDCEIGMACIKNKCIGKTTNIFVRNKLIFSFNITMRIFYIN